MFSSYHERLIFPCLAFLKLAGTRSHRAFLAICNRAMLTDGPGVWVRCRMIAVNGPLLSKLILYDRNFSCFYESKYLFATTI